MKGQKINKKVEYDQCEYKVLQEQYKVLQEHTGVALTFSWPGSKRKAAPSKHKEQHVCLACVAEAFL